MAEKNKLRKERKEKKMFPEYKKLRNKVKNLVRKAKKEYFQKLIERVNDISSVYTDSVTTIQVS